MAARLKVVPPPAVMTECLRGATEEEHWDEVLARQQKQREQSGRSIASLAMLEELMPPPAAASGPSLNVLFAGGCHLAGFPVSRMFGCSRIASDRLAEEYALSASVLSYVSLGSTRRILEACRAVRPDVLVLQLGHYEMAFFYERLRQAAGLRLRPRKPAVAFADGELSLDVGRYLPDVISRPGPLERMRWHAKYPLSAAGRLLGRPLFDEDQVRAEARGLFAAVADLRIPHVLVLHPLASQDPWVHACRLRTGAILAGEQAQYGFSFLNLARELNAPEYFWDASHLNRDGHGVLGNYLAAAVQSLVTGQAEAAAKKPVSPAALELASSCALPARACAAAGAPLQPA